MVEEKLLELGFNKRLNLLEKWNFRKLKDRIILKKNLPGCTLYFLIKRPELSDLVDLVTMQVKFSMFGKYHRLDFVKYLGDFEQHPFIYGDLGINFPDEEIEK